MPDFFPLRLLEHSFELMRNLAILSTAGLFAKARMEMLIKKIVQLITFMLCLVVPTSNHLLINQKSINHIVISLKI